MNLRKKALSLVLAALVLAGCAGFAQAAPNGNASGMSQEQRLLAQEIINRNYQAMEATRQALTEKRAQLDEEMASANPNAAAIENLSREIGELRGKMLAARAGARAELAKNGLATDAYAPKAQRQPRYRDQDYDRGDGYWHHGDRGRHHGPRGHGYWRCGPCWQ